MEYVTLSFVFFALVFDKLNIFLYLVICSLLHELGHIAACIICKEKPVVNFSIFGIKLRRYTNDRYKKLTILIAGPAVNLVLMLVSYGWISYEYSLKAYVFMAVNAIIFLFNMLPVNFLDGGQILALFCRNHILRKTADLISFFLLVILIFAFSNNTYYSFAILLFFAVYYFLQNKGN